MKQKNKSEIVLLATILALVSGTALLIQKLTPFVTHTFYYCESIARSLSWQVPQWVVYSLELAAVSLIIVSIAKIGMVLAHARQLRGKIVPYTLSAKHQQLLEQLGLTKKFIVIDDARPVAFCFGLFRPSIYVSNTLLDVFTLPELETILRHELYHLEHKDTLIMLGIYSIQHFFPFFPLLSDLIKNYRIERELRADQAAIAGRGESGSLVQVLKKLLLHEQASYAYVPSIADEDTLDARIQALIHGHCEFSTFRPINIITSLAFLGVVGSLFFIPVQASEAQDSHAGVMVCYYSNEKVVQPHQNKSVPYTPAK